MVVKPAVSSGARDTGRFTEATHDLARELIASIQASGRTALVQPCLASVDERGETALVFMAGELSHVLHKRAVLEPDRVALMLGEDGPALAMLARLKRASGATFSGSANQAWHSHALPEPIAGCLRAKPQPRP